MASGSHVVELPIPTRYFLERLERVVPRVGARTALKTLWVLARFRMHTARAPLGRPAASPPRGCRLPSGAPDAVARR